MDFNGVCRVELASVPGRRGSGFLIAPDKILTAAHVVRDPMDATRAVAGKEAISVTFAQFDDQVPAATSLGGVEDPDRDFNADDDWAVVRLRTPPAIQPYQAHPLEPTFGTQWSTFGFSREAPDVGRGYGGAVRTFAGERNQLAIATAGGIAAAGLSGAPVFVNGLVVALIAAIPDGEVKAAETLFAVPMTVVARHCKQFPIPLEEPLFYLTVADWIVEAPASLEAARKVLRLQWSGGAHVELAKEIARLMMRLGVGPTTAALKPLASRVTHAAANEILRMAASTWLDVKAVDCFWSLVTDPLRERLVLLLNARNHHVGDWYGLRGRCLEEDWPGRGVVVRCPRPDDLVAQLHRELSTLFGCDLHDVEERAQEWDYAAQPVVAVVGGPPAAAQVAAAHDAFPMVRLLLAVGPTFDAALARFPAALKIEPILPSGADDGVVTDYVKGLNDFTVAYRQIPPR